MTSSSKQRTRWGLLTLVEEPLLAPGVERRPMSDRVPRKIDLHGESTYIGRVRKGALAMPQTMINLSYISSSHCCFFLKRRAVGIHAEVRDTSSNGTYVNGEKVVKTTSVPIKTGDTIALYQPAGPAPLGMPILYKLQLWKDNFAMAITEKTTAATAESGSGAKRTKRNDASSTSHAYNAGSAPAPPRDASDPAGESATESPRDGVAGMPSTSTPAGTSAGAPSPTNGLAAARTLSSKRGSPLPAESVFAMLDDKNAIRKAAEAEAQKAVQEQIEGLMRQTRSLRSRLDESTKKHQDLVTNNNALKEALADAESNSRREEERVAQERERDRKMKAAMAEMEGLKTAAVSDARQQRARAEKAERGEAEARSECNTVRTELRGQVEALIAQNNRYQQTKAELAGKNTMLEKDAERLRAQVADALGAQSGLDAQLKEARESARELRSKLADQEGSNADLRQRKAELEGKLAQRERELASSEQERKAIEEGAADARDISLALQESQAALSRVSKELEESASLLAAERASREAAEAARSDAAGEAATQASECTRLQGLLEAAIAEGVAARKEAEVLRGQLDEADKRHRAGEAKLSQTISELERVRNRREGAREDAAMMGRQMEKAKRGLEQMKDVLIEHLAKVLGHVELPAGLFALDSQAGIGGSLVGDDIAGKGDSNKKNSNNGREDSHHSGGVTEPQNDDCFDADGSPATHRSYAEDDQEEEIFGGTQVTAAAAGRKYGDGGADFSPAGRTREPMTVREEEAEGVADTDDEGVGRGSSGGAGEAAASARKHRDSRDDDLTESEELPNTQDEQVEGKARTSEQLPNEGGSEVNGTGIDSGVGGGGGGDGNGSSGSAVSTFSRPPLTMPPASETVDSEGTGGQGPQRPEEVLEDIDGEDENDTPLSVPALDFGRRIRAPEAPEAPADDGNPGGPPNAGDAETGGGESDAETEVLTKEQIQWGLEKASAGPAGEAEPPRGSRKRARVEDVGEDKGRGGSAATSEEEEAPHEKRARMPHESVGDQETTQHGQGDDVSLARPSDVSNLMDDDDDDRGGELGEREGEGAKCEPSAGAQGQAEAVEDAARDLKTVAAAVDAREAVGSQDSTEKPAAHGRDVDDGRPEKPAEGEVEEGEEQAPLLAVGGETIDLSHDETRESDEDWDEGGKGDEPGSDGDEVEYDY